MFVFGGLQCWKLLINELWCLLNVYSSIESKAVKSTVILTSHLSIPLSANYFNNWKNYEFQSYHLNWWPFPWTLSLSWRLPAKKHTSVQVAYSRCLKSEMARNPWAVVAAEQKKREPWAGSRKKRVHYATRPRPHSFSHSSANIALFTNAVWFSYWQIRLRRLAAVEELTEKCILANEKAKFSQ